MSELLVDWITSLDGYGADDGWPGWWGLQGPEYLAWLADAPEADHMVLMGATTYRLMSGFATQSQPSEEDALDELAAASKIVFSSTLEPPLTWPNTRLVRDDAVQTVKTLKEDGQHLRTIGSVSLCRSLLMAGLVNGSASWSSRSSPARPGATASTTAIPMSGWK